MVRYLNCYNNQISFLPLFPLSLTILYCGQNRFAWMPPFPASLLELACTNNALSSLPALPGGLTSLICWNNRLTLLPTLPASLTSLDCEGNLLRSLPLVPAGIRFLRFQSNPLNVYFAKTAAAVVETNSVPLCVAKIAEYNKTVAEIRRMWKDVHNVYYALQQNVYCWLSDDILFRVGSFLSGEGGSLLSQKRGVLQRLEEYMA